MSGSLFHIFLLTIIIVGGVIIGAEGLYGITPQELFQKLKNGFG